jgi:phage I-like protein
MKHILQAYCSSLLPDITAQQGQDGGTVMQEIQIMQGGRFTLADGRGPFILMNPENVIANSKRLKVDLLIDRDHETQLAPKGSHIKAAGWIKSMHVKEDGIWAMVEWTKTAAQQITDKEYRYISPVFNYEIKTGEITRITHASLTNDPAMELTALASQNSNPQNGDIFMNEHLKALAAKIGLSDPVSEKAIETAVLAHIQKLEADHATALASAEHSSLDPSQYVPMEQHKTLASQFANLQKSILEEKVNIVVESAMKDGKIAPAQKEWAKAYAHKDLEGFQNFIDSAPVILASQSLSGNMSDLNGGSLTRQQSAIAHMLNIPETKMAKAVSEQ